MGCGKFSKPARGVGESAKKPAKETPEEATGRLHVRFATESTGTTTDGTTSISSAASSMALATSSATSSMTLGRRHAAKAQTVTQVLFPMYVVPIQTLLSFDLIPVHEELLERGLLELVESIESTACIHFISHVWLSSRHPDPEGVKLRHFQKICQQILDGDPRGLFDPADWEAFSAGSSGAKTFQALRSELAYEACLEPDSFQQDILEGYVWMDYMSVPQQTHRGEVVAMNQQKAIASIPNYIERSAYFWVLAPDAMHAERNMEVNYEVWQSRGWCRLEEWGNFLSVRVAPPLIVTDAKHIGVVDTMDFLAIRSGIGGLARHAACQGCFTCCAMGHQITRPDGQKVQIRCDKEVIQTVLERMLPSKLDHYQRSGKSFMWRFLTNTKFSVYAGSTLMDPPADVTELLQACGAEAVDSNYEGLTPLTWACTYGSVKLVRELLDLGARADQSVTILQCAAQRGCAEVMQILLDSGHLSQEALCKGSPKANITALDRGAKAGRGETCRLLLAARASPDPVRKDNGQTPLHTAAECGHAEVCRVLLEGGAEKDAIDSQGRTPLALTARRLTLFGSGTGKADCARLLLNARADLEIKDKCGLVAAAVAIEDGHRAFLHELDVFIEGNQEMFSL